jgi:hypothetical protein
MPVQALLFPLLTALSRLILVRRHCSSSRIDPPASECVTVYPSFISERLVNVPVHFLREGCADLYKPLQVAKMIVRCIPSLRTLSEYYQAVRLLRLVSTSSSFGRTRQTFNELGDVLWLEMRSSRLASTIDRFPRQVYGIRNPLDSSGEDKTTTVPKRTP